MASLPEKATLSCDAFQVLSFFYMGMRVWFVHVTEAQLLQYIYNSVCVFCVLMFK